MTVTPIARLVDRMRFMSKYRGDGDAEPEMTRSPIIVDAASFHMMKKT